MNSYEITKLREVIGNINLSQLSTKDLNEFVHIVSGAAIRGNNELNARNR